METEILVSINQPVILISIYIVCCICYTFMYGTYRKMCVFNVDSDSQRARASLVCVFH